MLIHKLISRYLGLFTMGIVAGEGGNSGNDGNDVGDGTNDEQNVLANAANDNDDNADDTNGAGAGADSGTGDGTNAGDVAEEEVILVDGQELPPTEEAKPWVRELRKKFKEQSQRLAQYERGTPSAPSDGLPPEPGAKPKIENFDFDGEKFATALDKWHEAKQARTAAENKIRDQQSQEQRDWEQRVTDYQSAGKKLGFSDFEDCESAADAELSLTQQGIILQGADTPEKAALIKYALGRNMSMTRELAKMTDPVKFAFAIADLQRKLTVIRRKPTTKPESVVSGGAGAADAMIGSDKKLDALREDAARTGDMSKLLAYQRQARTKQRQAA